MNQIMNIYCDECCHLNYKEEKLMGFGGITCPLSKVKEINENIREIKKDFNIPTHQELKWSKVSNCNVELYKKVINYFFIDDDISFRAFIVTNKDKLKFNKKNLKSDFYYKMLYYTIINVINPEFSYNIYLDIKDTNSAQRVENLKYFLNKSKIDYNLTNTILKIQTIKSYESSLLQLADVLIGALVYLHNGNKTSAAKMLLIDYIKLKSKKTLLQNTLRNEPKFNIFIADATRMTLRGEDDL